jgi:hypothetical protein
MRGLAQKTRGWCRIRAGINRYQGLSDSGEVFQIDRPGGTPHIHGATRIAHATLLEKQRDGSSRVRGELGDLIWFKRSLSPAFTVTRTGFSSHFEPSRCPVKLQDSASRAPGFSINLILNARRDRLPPK